MKSFIILCFLFAATLPAIPRADYDPPNFENAETERNVDNGHEDYLDILTGNGGFKLFNGATGTVNMTLKNEIEAALTARLNETATPDVRQCNRLSETPLACYACENGAANISRAEVAVVLQAKIYYSVHNNYDSAAEKIDSHSFALPRNSFGYIFTPTIPCRAVPTCYANTTTQLQRFELEGPRLVSFERVAGKMLIHRMNLGAHFSQVTGNAFPTTLFVGERLVPQSIMDNTALMGVFCFVPSKRRSVEDVEQMEIQYFANRGLPGIDEPSGPL